MFPSGLLINGLAWAKEPVFGFNRLDQHPRGVHALLPDDVVVAGEVLEQQGRHSALTQRLVHDDGLVHVDQRVLGRVGDDGEVLRHSGPRVGVAAEQGRADEVPGGAVVAKRGGHEARVVAVLAAVEAVEVVDALEADDGGR
ncbi:hypothetical protein PoMZ_02069 [Pyricularia oryzae]|uniref:Uncharacterized protein n=1 Tax=Pyricularia oryzae TaxID=318829 RepID=A0A4P7N868_PYROR|nr:hypothetical protein PoMZ_02069 [Pyricularia oryzae]